MGKRIRFFYFSDRHLDYREISWFRTKMLGLLVLSVSLTLVSLLVVNHFYNDFLGLGYNRIGQLTAENTFLKSQLETMSARLLSMEETLDRLNERNNELRLLVDLPRIDDDTRQVGIGGRKEGSLVGITSTATRTLLASIDAHLDRLSREADLQRRSHEEIVSKYEENQDFFARIPALKPMDGYYSVTGFGRRMHPVLGIYKTHGGLDIVNDVGTPVYASGKGVVEFAGRSGGGYGIVVVINHGYGYQSLYAHLSKTTVRAGQTVRRGDIIGRSGRTGLVSGPHLHYEVRYRGVKQNPIDYFFDDLRPGGYRELLSASN